MTVTLTYLDGDTLTLENVQAVVLAGPNQVILRCFGNDDVMHRNVWRVDTEPFVFPTVQQRHRVVCLRSDGVRRTIKEFDSATEAAIEARHLNDVSRDVGAMFTYAVEAVR